MKGILKYLPGSKYLPAAKVQRRCESEKKTELGGPVLENTVHKIKS